MYWTTASSSKDVSHMKSGVQFKRSDISHRITPSCSPIQPEVQEQQGDELEDNLLALNMDGISNEITVIEASNMCFS